MIDLRPLETDEDVDTYVDVRNRIHPDTPLTPEQVRDNPSEGRLDLVAYLDGTPVGAGSTARHFDDASSPTAYASARVLREHRCKGVGTAILARISEHARADGRDRLYVVVRLDDEDSCSYFGKRGFDEALRMEEVVLDPAQSRVEMPELPGLELVPLDESLDRAVYDAACAIEPDLSSALGVTGLDYDRWHARNLGPLADRACSFAALDGDVVVGYAILGHGGADGIGDHWMTGVRRAYRGRGVARALKVAQIAAARERGFTELRTTNASDNVPMRRVNERLGYRATLTWLHLRGPLLPA